MAWRSGTEVFKVIDGETLDEKEIFLDVNRAIKFAKKGIGKGKNLKVIRDTMEVWFEDESDE